MSTRELKWGTYGGLAGGMIFGGMMGMMGMLPMIGSMVGQPSAAVGFAVHIVNSAIIGAIFAIVLGRFVNGTGSGLGAGLAYGGAWWVLGPLTLMPLFMGMEIGRELERYSCRRDATQPDGSPGVRRHPRRDL